MPALLEISLETPHQRPTGLLGIPLHGLVFSALEQVSPALSTRIHEADVKPFRIGQNRWDEVAGEPGQVSFQLGVLDDDLLDKVVQALAEGSLHGSADTTLRGEVTNLSVVQQESYSDLYARHASGITGRQLHFDFLSPTTFKVTDLDMPFPLPKTLFYGLQRRWEQFSDLHFGPELGEWISRAVHIQDFHLRPRRVHFKGARGAALTACVGEVDYMVVRPGDAEPTFVRLLAEYANYTGVGYKTAYGLGHVETGGWRTVAGTLQESQDKTTDKH